MADRSTAVAALIALSAVVAGCDSQTGASDPTAASGVTTAVELRDGFDHVTATLAAPGTDGVELTFWYAVTPDQRHQGLTGVTDLGTADGMLFEFDGEGIHRFHMWQTPMPLDIYFFDSRGGYVGMTEMVPCLDGTASGCERYSPDVPFLIAIEVPAGSFDFDVDETWTITHEAPLDSPPTDQG